MCVAALGVRLSRVTIPSRRLRLLIYHNVYGNKYSALNERECEQPLSHYPSLNALFTRGVRPELRPIAPAANQYLCPCDSVVQEAGRLTPDRSITVKGTEYTIDDLLPTLDTRPFHGGHFAVFFLSPSDCHRVFSPQDGAIEEVIHVPGYRLLVHPPFQRKEYPVFALNERVIIRLATPHSPCVLVLVAGWGVGNITLPFHRQFRPGPRTISRASLTERVKVQRGQWIATFELGSTVILILSAGNGVTGQLARNQKVNYGEPAFTVDR